MKLQYSKLVIPFYLSAPHHHLSGVQYLLLSQLFLVTSSAAHPVAMAHINFITVSPEIPVGIILILFYACAILTPPCIVDEFPLFEF